MPSVPCGWRSIAGLTLTLACAAQPTEPAPVTSLAHGPAATAARLPLYGLDRPAPGWNGCGGPAYRTFDFWIGRWDVTDPAHPDALIGTNEVTRDLRGCAIEEHWTDQAGGRGRSLNTYDEGTGTWNQLWMDASGLALIVSGAAVDGSVTMDGDTPAFIGGPIITNRLTWSRIDAGPDVRQVWEVSEDGRTTWNTVFTGTYTRRGQITPAAEVPNGFCGSAARARFHWFDFLIGNWDIRENDAAGASLGTMRVAKDVSDCLVETTLERPGYRGKAYSAFHFPSLTWYRTWIDEDGVRIALRGGLVGGRMVMTGERITQGVTRTLRATWTPSAPGRVEETWEVSDDGGSTWVVDRTFVLIAK